MQKTITLCLLGFLIFSAIGVDVKKNEPNQPNPQVLTPNPLPTQNNIPQGIMNNLAATVAQTASQTQQKVDGFSNVQSPDQLKQQQALFSKSFQDIAQKFQNGDHLKAFQQMHANLTKSEEVAADPAAGLQDLARDMMNPADLMQGTQNAIEKLPQQEKDKLKKKAEEMINSIPTDLKDSMKHRVDNVMNSLPENVKDMFKQDPNTLLSNAQDIVNHLDDQQRETLVTNTRELMMDAVHSVMTNPQHYMQMAQQMLDVLPEPIKQQINQVQNKIEHNVQTAANGLLSQGVLERQNGNNQPPATASQLPTQGLSNPTFAQPPANGAQMPPMGQYPAFF